MFKEVGFLKLIYLIICPVYGSTLVCNSKEGVCAWTEYHCTQFEACQVKCTRYLACRHATIYGPTNYPLIIHCYGWESGSDGLSCANIVIHAENSSSLEITVNTAPNEISQALIYAPYGVAVHQPATFINCLSSACFDFTVFAQGGFNDVQIYCNDQSNCLSSTNSITMHCGPAPYRYHCTNPSLIFNEGKYICNPISSICNAYTPPTNNPTDTPTRRPTQLPSTNPTWKPSPMPTVSTFNPTETPTQTPTNNPTETPTTKTKNPTEKPTHFPTYLP
eukprot:179481_1